MNAATVTQMAISHGFAFGRHAAWAPAAPLIEQ
jgi:hypothetical protein